jgi:hypothetical protein
MTSRGALYETIKMEKRRDSIGGKEKVDISIMLLIGKMRRPISFRASLWNIRMKIGIDVPFSIRESCGLHPQL